MDTRAYQDSGMASAIKYEPGQTSLTTMAKIESGVEVGFRELDIQVSRFRNLVEALEQRLQRALTEGSPLKSPDSISDINGPSGLAYTIMSNADAVCRGNNALETIIDRIDL